MANRGFSLALLSCTLLVSMGPVFEKPAHAQAPSNVDELLGSCPSAQDVASIDADLALSFESDPTAGALVCTGANGSQDLTFLQKNAYQILRVARQLPFDAPFPWTTKTNLYDWLKGAIHGIRFRGDITVSFCCDPSGVININEGANSYNVLTDRWGDPKLGGFGLDQSLDVVVHEARHSEGLPHTCAGGSDETIAELGAWGVVYYYFEWLAFHTGTFLTATAPDIVSGGTDVNGNPLSSSYYRDSSWRSAQFTRDTRICFEPTFLVAPVALDFGTQEKRTTSVPHTVALTAGTPTTIEISNIELTGADAGDFILKVASCPNATVPPSCVLTVSFSPTKGIGSKAAEVTINDTASGSPHTVPLTGTATHHHPSRTK